MRKVSVFIGSPRKNGNTEAMVSKIIEGINTLDIGTEKIFLVDNKIEGCKGCYSCIRTGKCVRKDDMTLVYSKIEEADGLIFASPAYNYNITSEMKALIDRLFCYYQFKDGSQWKSRLGNNKKALVLGVCAGESEDNMGYTLTAMKRPLEDLGIKVIKEISYYNSRKIPILKNESFQKELFNMGIEFGKEI